MNQLAFLRSVWRVFSLDSDNTPSAWRQNWVDERVYLRLGEFSSVGELTALCHAEGATDASFEKTIDSLNRDWDRFSANARSELIKIIKYYELESSVSFDLLLTAEDTEELGIRWDISDVLYFARKLEAIEDCKKSGIDLENGDINLSIQTKAFPEALKLWETTILSVLKYKLELDIAVAKVASPGNFRRYTAHIKNRLRSECLDYLDDLRPPLTKMFQALAVSGRGRFWIVERTEDCLKDFKKDYEKLISKVSEFQPTPSTLRRVQEMVSDSKYQKPVTNYFDVREMTMGDKFENVRNATIVNRSLVERSFNKVKSDFDEETANALKLVAAEIEKSGNKDAADNFESFNEELQKPEPKKSVLRSLWAGITSALPSILQMTDVVAKTSKLLGY